MQLIERRALLRSPGYVTRSYRCWSAPVAAYRLEQCPCQAQKPAYTEVAYENLAAFNEPSKVSISDCRFFR